MKVHSGGIYRQPHRETQAFHCEVEVEEVCIKILVLVLILDYFISQKNLEKIFKVMNEIQSDKFYINMAESWLICEIYIKFPKETEEFLKKNNLNKFTQNKAISKIHDSYRIGKDEKELLNKYRKI